MMSVILYLWVIILQLYHYDSRLLLKNLNIGILSFFSKTFRLSSLIRVYVYIKEKENAYKSKVLEKSTKGSKVNSVKSVIKLYMNSSFRGS